MTAFNTAILPVYGLLTAALLAVWLPPSLGRIIRVPIWAVLFGLSAALGLYYGIVEPGGVVYLAGLGAFCYLTQRPAIPVYARVLAGLTVVAMVAALFLHSIPFFNNPLVFDAVSFGDRSAPYTQYWNFDKAAAGLILLAFFGDIGRSGHGWRVLIWRGYGIAIVTVGLTVMLAWLFGYIAPELTIEPVYFAWAWANLFFTCVAEEMLFRGFAQKHLAALNANNAYKLAIVVFVGILFGLAHFAGGITYVILASVAGIGYGYVYHVTGRIESAILTHFLLNSVHFLFFTYPYANGVM
jgi:membrane protease YdiL (CAAX protease family)